MPTEIEWDRMMRVLSSSRMNNLGNAIDRIVTIPGRIVRRILAAIKARTCLRRQVAPDSFAIERRDDSTVFVTATDFTIDTDGRLIFYLRRKKVAAYNTDWKRTQRGLSAADLED